ncbi:MAG: Cyclic di-GMP phosphodiesterase PdeB [Arcobacter lacus]|nr:MAG: Cyclic di-GMP phosphodiesterase PdeB [Arcobacter lacus]
MNINISNLKNITVLYVEDEDDLRNVTSQILKNFTKKQFLAQNGKEGLDIFKENEKEIDLVITDINMPIMNGLDMIKKIKEINFNIPIIVATAFSNKEYLLEAIDIGVDKYVLKPIDVSKLLHVMAQSLIYHELKELYIDSLTSLPNRNQLLKDLNQSQDISLALVDIDSFAKIDDLFGEDNGDLILIELANSLKSYFDSMKYKIYRIEADKFAVISDSNIINVDEFFESCKKFANQMEKNAIEISGNEIDIDITIGIANDKGPDTYKYSKRAITTARVKKKRVLIYDDSLDMRKSYEDNLKWIKILKEGFKEDLFKAYFQAIVDTKTKKVYKYEALIRYVKPDSKLVPPYKFLDVAKSTKYYANIIRIILKDSLELIINKDKKVSINISFEDISNEDTKKYIFDTLDKHKDYTHNLEFEILESEGIDDINLVKNFIKKIKSYGCKVGIDDFGSGYSNFNLLTILDVDFVKIDGSLVKEINQSSELEIIVSTINNFSQKIGLTTIAEFVADEEIYEKIKEIGTDYCQGYYFNEPSPYETID